MSSDYYMITFGIQDADSAQDYEFIPGDDVSIFQGHVYSDQKGQTSVRFAPNILHWSCPAGENGGHVMVVTSANTIRGQLRITGPFKKYPFVLTLYGSTSGWKFLGEAVIQPGQTWVDFEWKVPANQGMTLTEAMVASSSPRRPLSI